MDCKHHWVIESANGPESSGQCRKCGAERLFANTVQRYEGWSALSKADYADAHGGDQDVAVEIKDAVREMYR